MEMFRVSPQQMLMSFWHHRVLISTLGKREIQSRYRGSVLGMFWSFLQPVLLLIVYTYVFSVVFKARWNPTSESKTEFALVLFSGLIVFNFFAECINRAPGLILSNVNYVKKVVFPIEILPWISMGTAMFHMLISMGVWFIAYFIIFGLPSLTVLWLPIVLLPIVPFIMGLSWGLASLGVYLRDISQFIGLVTMILMFTSPLFYSVSALPEHYRSLLQLNPLTPIIEQVRDVLFWGKSPDMMILCSTLLRNSVIAWLGFVCFQKMRRGFSDVL